MTNAGQVMSIILMLMGSFYLAMPLTAAATTFYTVHMIYEEKRKQAAQDKQQPPCTENNNSTTASNSSNNKPFTSTTTTAATTADTSPALYGDFLDRKLQKRVNLLLGDLFLLQSALAEFHKDLHQTSTEYDDDAYIQHSGSKKHAYVEINNRKIPILKKLHSSSSSSSNITTTTNTTTPMPGQKRKSELLHQLQSMVLKIDTTLAQSEEDILRLVVLHHKLRKNF